MKRSWFRIVLMALAMIAVPLGGLAWYWLATFPDVPILVKKNPSVTALMAARTEEAAESGRPYKRQWNWVALSEMSPLLQRAVVAAEDANFFSHEGFDWDGIKVAMERNLEAGKIERGGSTITQQVAKNLFLTQDRSFFRKAREAMITRALERHLSKARILEIYLNIAEWGEGVYGAEAAARHYFFKSAKELTADESALLAAMLPSPLKYDPLRLTPFLVKRQHQILSWMGVTAMAPQPHVQKVDAKVKKKSVTLKKKQEQPKKP
jgi:monofunctional biosynthetic peptidoglycan transglycosylase